MQKILSALENIRKINLAYDISDEKIGQLLSEIPEAKVCTPVIGKFSSGKSALVNTFLGYNRKILREDITPETAIPAEILYTESEDSVEVIKNDGTRQPLSVNDYRNFVADAKTVKCARIRLKNSRLETIPDVMLVDMPGFESGFEIHNRAIDDYLPQSLAYIVTFPADDMIVRSSVGNIFKELCLNDMPLCVAITKFDKRNDDFETTFANLKENLKRYVGDREIRFCRTSSFDGEVSEFEKYLVEIQEQSQEILVHKYIKPVAAIIENTENYLKTTLNGSQMTESELAQKEEKLKEQFDSLGSRFSREQTNFEEEISDCIDEIKNDVQCALEGETSTLVSLAINCQNVNDHLNNLVRNTITVSLKKRFAPRMEKHLKKVSDFMSDGSIGDVNVHFSFDADSVNKGISATVVGVAAGILLLNPIIGLIAGFIAKHLQDKKREEAKQQVRMKLHNEVYPQILRDVGKSIKIEIIKQVKMVNQSIEDEFKNQKETLEKAMADLRNQINDEKARKENLAADIKADLESLDDIKAILGVA